MRRTRRRRRRLQPNGRMLATAARAGDWGGRVMRKSRVVNLCDNILCETFLFLVQRELQRSTEHGARTPPTPTPGRRETGGRQGYWGRCEGAEGCCGCACLRLTLAIARKMARTVCSLFLASPGKGKGKRQKKQQLCPVTCALLHTHTQGVGGCAVGVWGVGVCVQSAAVAVGALLLPHFIVFVVLPSG